MVNNGHLQASGWSSSSMGQKHLPSPVRRSTTPEQSANKTAAGNHEGVLLPSSTSSPVTKKQRGNREGDGPLNLSKSKGIFIQKENYWLETH
jgi:hypothetical protein